MGFELGPDLTGRRRERPRHADQHHRRHANHPAICQQEAPQSHRSQYWMNRFGKLYNLRGLIHNHHGATQDQKTAAEQCERLDRFFHRHRSSSRLQGGAPGICTILFFVRSAQIFGIR